MSSSTYVGCYSRSTGFENQTSYIYQSSGWCLQQCVKTHAASFALTGGSDCLCGNELPPNQTKVAQERCDRACNGFLSDMCGGDGFYSVYTTGLKKDIPTYPESQSSTSTNTDASQSKVTASSDTSAVKTPEPPSKRHNTTAIIVGVVVGVCALAALLGAAFFWWRSRRHKRQTDSDSHSDDTTMKDGNNSNIFPFGDPRLNGAYMTQCYHSNGSLNEYNDYSRRILHVTNPSN